MPNPEFPELIELQQLYHTAEKRIKTAETLNDELSIPSINELRYAGRHLIDALCFLQCEAENYYKLIDEAKIHCRRAIFDADEISINYLLKELDAFEKHYKYVEYHDLIPDYAENNREIVEAKKFMESNHSRSTNNFENAEKYFDELLRIHDEIITCEPFIRKRGRIQGFKLLGYILSILIAILAIIVTIMIA